MRCRVPYHDCVSPGSKAAVRDRPWRSSMVPGSAALRRHPPGVVAVTDTLADRFFSWIPSKLCSSTSQAFSFSGSLSRVRITSRWADPSWQTVPPYGFRATGTGGSNPYASATPEPPSTGCAGMAGTRGFFGSGKPRSKWRRLSRGVRQQDAFVQHRCIEPTCPKPHVATSIDAKNNIIDARQVRQTPVLPHDP